jgi:uncharacterized membrane protein
VGNIFAKILQVWIAAFAALTFLVAIILALAGVLSWWSVLYVYIGISVVTLVLAALVYMTRE